MKKEEAVEIAREAAELLGRSKVDDVSTGYYIIKEHTIKDGDEDVIVDVVADIIKYVDETDGHMYYGVYNFADISGGDNICDSDYGYTDHLRQKELADLLLTLANTDYTDAVLEEMYRKAVA